MRHDVQQATEQTLQTAEDAIEAGLARAVSPSLDHVYEAADHQMALSAAREVAAARETAPRAAQSKRARARRLRATML